MVAEADLIASRPIAGHANLCPGSISTKPQELETLLSTVKHEILHALGFSVSLYAFYRDENGEPRTPRRSDTGKPPLNEKYVFPAALALLLARFHSEIPYYLAHKTPFKTKDWLGNHPAVKLSVRMGEGEEGFRRVREGT